MAANDRSTDALRTALALIGKGILTPRAGRALSYFTEHGVFCEPLRMPNGDLSIIFLERCYTPAAFNALMEGRYAPTAGDVLASINALAASPEPVAPPVEPQGPTAASDDGDDDARQPTPPPDGVLAGLRALADLPDDRPAPGSPEADEQLAAIYQAASQRPGGAGALTWGLALLIGVLGAIALLGFWQVAQLIGSR